MSSPMIGDDLIRDVSDGCEKKEFADEEDDELSDYHDVPSFSIYTENNDSKQQQKQEKHTLTDKAVLDMICDILCEIEIPSHIHEHVINQVAYHMGEDCVPELEKLVKAYKDIDEYHARCREERLMKKQLEILADEQKMKEKSFSSNSSQCSSPAYRDNDSRCPSVSGGYRGNYNVYRRSEDFRRGQRGYDHRPPPEEHFVYNDRRGSYYRNDNRDRYPSTSNQGYNNRQIPENRNFHENRRSPNFQKAEEYVRHDNRRGYDNRHSLDDRSANNNYRGNNRQAYQNRQEHREMYDNRREYEDERRSEDRLSNRSSFRSDGSFYRQDFPNYE